VPPRGSAAASAKSKGSANTKSKAKAQERSLEDGEVRALLSACSMDSSMRGCRDLLLICLAYTGGLKTVDLVNLALDDLHFDSRRGRVTLKVRQAGAKRAKHLPLENEQLIALEDWLEFRGRAEGPLFCPVSRSHRIEIKRVSAAEMREICDHRAEQSGVRPFAPNDLAKSSPPAGDAAKRRRSKVRPETDVSPLFDVVEEPAEPEHIHFPYRVKVGL
jgi:integrase